MQLSTPLPPLDALRPAPTAPTASASPDRTRKAAQDFEASFLSALLQPIFSAMPTDGPFGGGEGESTFRSFLVDEMARQTVRAGGIGLTDRVQAEMLKLQEGGAR